MHRLVALVLPEVVIFDLAIPSQVFGRIDDYDLYSFAVCTVDPGLVASTSGYAVEVPLGLDAIVDADTVVVPGFTPLNAAPAAALDALRAAAQRGARIVSVCTGAFALAAAGLLDGLSATTHWQDADALATQYPDVHVDPNVLYIDNGQVMTSAGIAAGIDLCLHLVRSDHGAAIAADIARHLVVAPHREGGQAQYVRRLLPPVGAGLAPTMSWALSRLDQSLSITDLARHAGWSSRTFARHFAAETGTTPLRWITAQRVLEARRLLETSELPIEQIADRCGLGSGANLRLRLARDTSATPSAYRTTYQGRRQGKTEQLHAQGCEAPANAR